MLYNLAAGFFGAGSLVTLSFEGEAGRSIVVNGSSSTFSFSLSVLFVRRIMPLAGSDFVWVGCCNCGKTGLLTGLGFVRIEAADSVFLEGRGPFFPLRIASILASISSPMSKSSSSRNSAFQSISSSL